ncbi:MAG: hypothetical protein QGD94_10825, partial [Planctomycetia bacterium]|nr:hypothetical protein [Planctomycetia bacterium]
MQKLEPLATGVIQRAYDGEGAAELAAIFCAGNGLLGLRASEPEDAGGEPGMLFSAGTFSKIFHPASDAADHGVLSNPEFFKKPVEERDHYLHELTLLPDPLSIILTVDGKRFHPSDAGVASYSRELDFANPVVIRKVNWRPSNGTVVEIESRYFTSVAQPNLVAMRYAVRFVEGKGEVELSSGLSWPTKQHKRTLEVGDIGKSDGILQFSGKTVGLPVNIALVVAQRAEGPAGKITPEFAKKEAGAFQKFASSLSAGQEIVLDKIVAVTTDADGPDTGGTGCLSLAKRSAADGLKVGIDGLEKAHLAAWRERWDDCDIEAEGDVGLQQGIRFSIYHLLIVEPPPDRSVSIGARTLSGAGYGGMVFWDTELFIVPLFQYTRPDAARRLLQYRADRMDAMRTLAKEFDLPGARAPWESNPDGTDGTPPWTRHQYTQLHVSNAIALGIYNQYEVTGDIEFTKDGLLEFML